MGSTSRNISKAFNFAISTPCVFMLDEVECISIKRSDTSGSGGTSGEMARITITLMQEFDKLPNDIIVVGATNRIDRIDEALLRRFSLKHEVKVFDRNEKMSMVSKYLDDIGMDFPYSAISEIIESNKNQSMILNDLIRLISKKILDEFEDEESE